MRFLAGYRWISAQSSNILKMKFIVVLSEYIISEWCLQITYNNCMIRCLCMEIIANLWEDTHKRTKFTQMNQL